MFSRAIVSFLLYPFVIFLSAFKSIDSKPISIDIRDMDEPLYVHTFAMIYGKVFTAIVQIASVVTATALVRKYTEWGIGAAVLLSILAFLTVGWTISLITAALNTIYLAQRNSRKFTELAEKIIEIAKEEKTKGKEKDKFAVN